jgi:soluble lytic murein transglycosylase-like protein
VQLVTGRPRNVTEMLDIAASHHRTFYGLLAARLLARELGFHWEVPQLRQADENSLAQEPGVRRAAALHQVGHDEMAEKEIRRLYPAADKDTRVALLALAERLGLAGAAMRLGVEWRDRHGEHFDAALYPVPRWEPAGGFSVDRALVYAFMRRESGFNTRAKSPVGARGLMQLMPRTASYVANDNSLRRKNREKLYDPEYNIGLGQRYLAHLLSHKAVNNNLFLLAAAYNGGPGNLTKWLRQVKHQQDPLMFIEGIPALETRIFIEKVLTNFWIYRIRLGQDTPSLDAIAAGNWPYYLSMDTQIITVAENVQN